MEDRIDTSDELIEADHNLVDLHDRFIAECQEQARRSGREQKGVKTGTVVMDEGERIIREAEASKARLYVTPGNNFNFHGGDNKASLSATVDENYLVIWAHVDPSLQLKIINNEYIDFARLVPKNKMSRDQDHKMELISKGGYTYFFPVSEHETANISSFSKWEQAFRVFSNIFTHAHPHKASELIQYNHVIQTAANSFIWDNVYTYNHEFRMQISHFPNRSWAVILQQVWSMYLKR